MDSNIYNLLKMAFDKNYLDDKIKDSFMPFLSNGIKFKVEKKGTQYINAGTELKCMHLLVKGDCHAISYTVDGKAVVIDSPSDVQIFGLYEMIKGFDGYSSTIETTSECYFVEIPIRDFKISMCEDIKVSNIVIQHLADVVDRCINKNYRELVNTSIQNFLLYLYNECKGKSFPYRVKMDRKTMASELNVSLRTIYRYIEELKDKGYINISSGKILITKEQFVNLEESSDGFCAIYT